MMAVDSDHEGDNNDNHHPHHWNDARRDPLHRNEFGQRGLVHNGNQTNPMDYHVRNNAEEDSGTGASSTSVVVHSSSVVSNARQTTNRGDDVGEDDGVMLEHSQDDDGNDSLSTPPFRVDQRVYAQDYDDPHQQYYEAVIRKARHNHPHLHHLHHQQPANANATTPTPTSEWTFLVHYTGWNARWDRWLTPDGILLMTPENQCMVLQQQANGSSNNHITAANAAILGTSSLAAGAATTTASFTRPTSSPDAVQFPSALNPGSSANNRKRKQQQHAHANPALTGRLLAQNPFVNSPHRRLRARLVLQHVTQRDNTDASSSSSFGTMIESPKRLVQGAAAEGGSKLLQVASSQTPIPSVAAISPRRPAVIAMLQDACELPWTLKMVLMEERERLTRVGGLEDQDDHQQQKHPHRVLIVRRQVHQLPAVVPIRKVLNHFAKKQIQTLRQHNNNNSNGTSATGSSSSDSAIATNNSHDSGPQLTVQQVQDFVQGLIDLFQHALLTCLLYPQERPQFEHYITSTTKLQPQNNTTHHSNNNNNMTMMMIHWVDVCGCEYLLRLLVRLPLLLLLTCNAGQSLSVSSSSDQYEYMKPLIIELIVLMQKNRSALFRSSSCSTVSSSSSSSSTAEYRPPRYPVEYTEAEKKRSKMTISSLSSVGGGGDGDGTTAIGTRNSVTK